MSYWEQGQIHASDLCHTSRIHRLSVSTSSKSNDDLYDCGNELHTLSKVHRHRICPLLRGADLDWLRLVVSDLRLMADLRHTSCITAAIVIISDFNHSPNKQVKAPNNLREKKRNMADNHNDPSIRSSRSAV